MLLAPMSAGSVQIFIGAGNRSVSTFPCSISFKNLHAITIQPAVTHNNFKNDKFCTKTRVYSTHSTWYPVVKWIWDCMNRFTSIRKTSPLAYIVFLKDIFITDILIDTFSILMNWTTFEVRYCLDIVGHSSADYLCWFVSLTCTIVENHLLLHHLLLNKRDEKVFWFFYSSLLHVYNILLLYMYEYINVDL